MGTREQLIVVFSKNGWDQLTSFIGSTFVNNQNRKDVLDAINNNDDHQTDSKGDHLLHFQEVDSSSHSMQLLLTKLMGNIHSKEWLVNMIFDDGTEDSYGGYYNSSFNVSVRRHLTWVDVNSVPGGKLNVADPVAPKPVASTPINNHKCSACGNDRCSKIEKTCWKCGNPL
jgi:hypothetical protein